MENKIMYIENKSAGSSESSRIGRVMFSRTGQTVYYEGRSLQSQKLRGLKFHYEDLINGDLFVVSTPKGHGADRPAGDSCPTLIDENVREEYWRDVRGAPERASEKIAD